MMRTQCLLGLRTFVAFATKLWSFLLYLLRRQVIQYQTVRYDVLPLSPAARNRLNQVKRKVLVLDLDETLIHSHHDGVMRPTVRPGTPPDFILKVVIDKHPVRFFVHKRPHVDFFLEVVSQWYELVVFTASMEIYGSAVADKLDNNRSILKRSTALWSWAATLRTWRWCTATCRVSSSWTTRRVPTGAIQVHSRRAVGAEPEPPSAPPLVTSAPPFFGRGPLTSAVSHRCHHFSPPPRHGLRPRLCGLWRRAEAGARGVYKTPNPAPPIPHRQTTPPPPPGD
ncbi:CTD nuclear envelope phosphatase 1 isoform X2 [Lepidochelys kempii]|uniref:CTD nuclear envelope phosphatase 1 isoform X2 n=1 Tax=Lepidochelys kempii TaxID=8472 RepID=UPI003C6F714D